MYLLLSTFKISPSISSLLCFSILYTSFSLFVSLSNFSISFDNWSNSNFLRFLLNNSSAFFLFNSSFSQWLLAFSYYLLASFTVVIIFKMSLSDLNSVAILSKLTSSILFFCKQTEVQLFNYHWITTLNVIDLYRSEVTSTWPNH